MEEGITREQRLTCHVEGHASGAVAGRVDHLDVDVADGDHLAVRQRLHLDGNRVCRMKVVRGVVLVGDRSPARDVVRVGVGVEDADQTRVVLVEHCLVGLDEL